MIRTPGFSSHEEQRKILGSAADLDPEKYPRRAEQARARNKLAAPTKKPAKGDTQLSRQRAERARLAPIAREMARSMTVMEVAGELKKSRRFLERLADEGGFAYQNRNRRNLKQLVDEFERDHQLHQLRAPGEA